MLPSQRPQCTLLAKTLVTIPVVTAMPHPPIGKNSQFCATIFSTDSPYSPKLFYPNLLFLLHGFIHDILQLFQGDQGFGKSRKSAPGALLEGMLSITRTYFWCYAINASRIRGGPNHSLCHCLCNKIIRLLIYTVVSFALRYSKPNSVKS